MVRFRPQFKWKLFGKHLREMRQSADLGLREAARELKFDKATWCRAEQGKPISVPQFIFLCDWMDASPFQYSARAE